MKQNKTPEAFDRMGTQTETDEAKIILTNSLLAAESSITLAERREAEANGWLDQQDKKHIAQIERLQEIQEQRQAKQKTDAKKHRFKQ